MAHLQITIDQEQMKSLLREDNGLAKLVESVFNQILEAEVTAYLGAKANERTKTRRRYRNRHRLRLLPTRVGTRELSVPRELSDRVV